VMLAHVAGIPAEEWLTPFILSAGAVLVGLRARFGSPHSTANQDTRSRDRSRR
jgi:hypothetical protein